MRAGTLHITASLFECQRSLIVECATGRLQSSCRGCCCCGTLASLQQPACGFSFHPQVGDSAVFCSKTNLNVTKDLDLLWWSFVIRIYCSLDRT